MRRKLFWPISFLLLMAVMAFGVMWGSMSIPLTDVWRALLGEGDAATIAVVQSLRVPRVLLAALVGAALAASGGVLQGVMRNPLAEPYLLGVSGGAAVGVVGAITLVDLPSALLPFSAFAGSAASVACVIAVARVAGGRSDARILLMAGVVVGAFANAVVMVLLASTSPDMARSALWWMMGSVADADWRTVGWLTIYLAPALLLLIVYARDVDALSLGADSAASLGVHVERATWLLFLLAALIAAATVSAVGLVGFVGLVVPHLARASGMRRSREVLLASALLGGALLVAADIVARTVVAPRELPLGAVTALIGVPYFLLRLRRTR